MKTKVIAGVMLTLFTLFLVSMLSPVVSVSAGHGWIPEDIEPQPNGDGDVDIYDIATAAAAFGSNNITGVPTPHWNPDADLKRDNVIDIFDLVLFAVHYGEVMP